MRTRWTLLTCVMSLGLAGCETAGPTIAVSDLSAPAAQQPPSLLSPDIRKILTAGGLDVDGGAGARGAVPGRMGIPTASPPSAAVLAAAASPSGPGAVEAAAPPGAVALAAPLPTRKGRHGNRADHATALAMASPLAPTPAPAAAVTPEYVAAPPGASRELPAGPLPAVSPLSPPPTTTRLASAAGEGLTLPPGAPTETTVSVAQPRGYDMNFTQGMPLSAPQPPPQRQAAFQPGVFGGVVSGPSAQQVLQPMLDPNSLVSAPRFTSRSHVQLTAHAPRVRMVPTPRMEAYAPQAEAAAIPAAMPAAMRAPAPQAPPAPRDDSPTVRRF